MSEETTRAYPLYPLYWPEGCPRTPAENRKWARFDDRSVYQARRVLETEVRRFGGKDLIVSSNLQLKLDGLPRSGQRQPEDRGVAIYFQRNKVDMALACDVYLTVEDNLWAICRTLQAFIRQIERDGSPDNRAFRGFAALPDPDAREWWEVLGVDRTATDAQIKDAYIDLAKKYHPDVPGGSAEMFDMLTKAKNLGLGRTK